MCGIVGGFDRTGRPFCAKEIESACQRMAHRGPDDEGVFSEHGVFLANRRLAILDVAAGHQPMVSDDGQSVIVQNGEIYNFVELSAGLGCRTKCDTEVLLRLFERDGRRFVDQLNGMFAIAVFDRREQVLSIYRDRLGQKPLYIYDDGTRLLFASEIKSLLAFGVPVEVDWDAVDAFLTYNYIPAPLTIFKNIQHVMPGTVWHIRRDRTDIEAWWKLQISEEQRTDADWQHELHDTLRDAVGLRLRSDVPLGAFLSGGLDSSVIVKLMAEQTSRTVKTYCVGLGDCRFHDEIYSQQAAEAIGTDHCVDRVKSELFNEWPRVLYHNDQPHGDISFLPTFHVSRLAKRDLTVVLTGDGSDELFAGYDLHRSILTEDIGTLSDNEFVQRVTNRVSLLNAAQRHELYSNEMLSRVHLEASSRFVEERLAAYPDADRVNQLLAFDTLQLLPGNNLVKPDKVAMAVSLEARSPFMDFRVVDLAFRMPGQVKLRSGETKAVLKRVAETMLPHDIVHRPKQMFSMPVGDWFRGPLQPLVREVLCSPSSRDRGIFDQRQLKTVVDEHMSMAADHTRAIRAFVALELWFRMYVDQSLQTAPTFADLGVEQLPEWSESRAA
ncbi:MAG TPA: asparagine synthase (glutamine-hydrolyzing) [Planctomycetes bacterium]|nr:asparagine synthase (glutamine-hydrolyzing) [Planctomycetota bacterium]